MGVEWDGVERRADAYDQQLIHQNMVRFAENHPFLYRWIIRNNRRTGR